MVVNFPKPHSGRIYTISYEWKHIIYAIRILWLCLQLLSLFKMSLLIWKAEWHRKRKRQRQKTEICLPPLLPSNGNSGQPGAEPSQSQELGNPSGSPMLRAGTQVPGSPSAAFSGASGAAGTQTSAQTWHAVITGGSIICCTTTVAPDYSILFRASLARLGQFECQHV